MIVHVTQKHIDRAREILRDDSKQSQRHCPVALALRDAGYRNPCVGDSWADLDDELVALPDDARDFIARFDDDQPVQPMAFELGPENYQ